MKVYIAGKINGDPNYRAKFEEAERLLEDQGLTVLNPAMLPEGLEQADYMRICLAMLESADVVVLLHDWYISQGACLERGYAAYTGKRVMLFEEWEVEP